MAELLEWYSENKDKMHPIELATEFHIRYIFIHPFIDGNRRTTRLLINLILMRNGSPITIIRNEDRDEYMKDHESASLEKNLKDILGIVLNAIDRSLDIYLYRIK